MAIMFTNMSYKFRNEEKTMKQWAEKFKDRGITIDVLRSRWKKGWRGDKLFQTIYKSDTTITYHVEVTHDTGNGEETKPLLEWAEEIGMNPNTLAIRYANGDRGEVLFRRKYHHRKTIQNLSSNQRLNGQRQNNP